jgi:hypothetical protein
MPKSYGFLSSLFLKESLEKLTNFMEEYMPARTSVRTVTEPARKSLGCGSANHGEKFAIANVD